MAAQPQTTKNSNIRTGKKSEAVKKHELIFFVLVLDLLSLMV